MKKEKSEWKLKLTKEQEEEVIKKWVMAMTKIIERLEEENKKLKKRVIELEKEREFLLEAHSVSAE